MASDEGVKTDANQGKGTAAAAAVNSPSKRSLKSVTCHSAVCLESNAWVGFLVFIIVCIHRRRLTHSVTW